MSVLIFLKFSTFQHSHHSWNCYHYSNQLELVVLKIYDTWCLSVSRDMPDIPDIPGIPIIPEISIVIQISLRSWFRKGITLYVFPDIPEILSIPSIPNIPDIPNIPTIFEIPIHTFSTFHTFHTFRYSYHSYHYGHSQSTTTQNLKVLAQKLAEL